MLSCSCIPTDSLQTSDYQEVYTLLPEYAQDLSLEVKIIIALAFKKAKNLSSPLVKNESLTEHSSECWLNSRSCGKDMI